MNGGFVFLIVLAIVLFAIIYDGQKAEGFAPPGPFSPFRGDYGYIAEHQFLRDWLNARASPLIPPAPSGASYGSRYFGGAPAPCILPPRTNMDCVYDELAKGRPYNRAVLSCTAPPSVDASCLKYFN